MENSIIELVTEIMEKGKFKKTKKSDAILKTELDKLFKMHKKEASEDSARAIYEGIIKLAKFGKGEMANKFAMRFEQEVGYGDLK
ncbi:MAG: hypothetical protein QXS38_00710 [Candidatus Pacearchaeota archaeon]